MLTTSYYTTSIFVFFITVQITKLKSFKELPSISHFDVTLRNAKFHFFWEVSILPSLSQVKKKNRSALAVPWWFVWLLRRETIPWELLKNCFFFFSKTIQSGKLKLVRKHPLLQNITVFQKFCSQKQIL